MQRPSTTALLQKEFSPELARTLFPKKITKAIDAKVFSWFDLAKSIQAYNLSTNLSLAAHNKQETMAKLKSVEEEICQMLLARPKPDDAGLRPRGSHYGHLD